MRGLCRDRSSLTAVLLASGLLAIAGPLSSAAQANEPGVGEHEAEWPLRTFAQPAFKPDFAAMSATIAAEPPPAVAAEVAPVAAPALRPTAESRAKPTEPRVMTLANGPAAQSPQLRLDSTWPKVVPKAAVTPQPNSETAEQYTPAEIADAKARCVAVLKGVDAVAVPEEPIRQGACGTAAPFQLISIGRNPQVALNPPAIVTCDMVAALTTWVKNDLQPSARRHLGSPIAKIETMSSYSCRNAYGRKRANLSEHGRANALDIRSFITAAQAESEVLAHWGPTGRDVRAQVAAAKAAADKASAERAVAAAKLPLRSTVPPGTPETTPNAGTNVAGAVGTMIGSVPNLAARLPGVKTDTSLGWTPPNRLGGPKQTEKAAASTDANHSGRTQFLRDAHTSACKIFGTVLGPESNDAHKNHFHVDMAERPNASHFCE
jgi:hypothetical protein